MIQQNEDTKETIMWQGQPVLPLFCALQKGYPSPVRVPGTAQRKCLSPESSPDGVALRLTGMNNGCPSRWSWLMNC